MKAKNQPDDILALLADDPSLDGDFRDAIREIAGCLRRTDPPTGGDDEDYPPPSGQRWPL